MPQCHQFVQNAWKKDLCSNCFKSKEEHSGGDGRSRYLATMIPVTTTTQAAKGILKDGQKPSRHPKGTRVIFPAEESQVIGYGGDEAVLSDDEDNDDGTGAEVAPVHVEETPSDGEHEREMQKLTRSNTDFNTVAANLLGVPTAEPKRSFAQLMLGKPLTDSDGRKKTLLVTVQPFGGAEPGESPVPVANNRKASVTRLTTDTPDKSDKNAVQVFKKGGDDTPGEIVLKPVVRNCVDKLGERGDVIKLDVKINETKYVEKNDNTNEIIRSIVDKQSTDEKNHVVKSGVEDMNSIPKDVLMKSVLRDVEIVNNRSEMSLSLNENKIQDDLTSMKENEGCDEKASKIPMIKSRVNSEKTKAVIRTSAFNGRADLETKIDDTLPKPAMRKSYDLNNKNSEYIIQKEKSSVVLNLIIKGKNNSKNNELNESEKISKSEKIGDNSELNDNHDVDSKNSVSKQKPVENSLTLTNGVTLELDEAQPKMVLSKSQEKIKELTKQEDKIAEVIIDDKMSPIVESKNSFNIAKQINSLGTPEVDANIEKSSLTNSVEESVKKLPTNIYRKLPALDEPIILKEVSKGMSTSPVRNVTIVEPIIHQVSVDTRKIEGEPAVILPSESAKEEIYNGTKLVVAGPPASEKTADSVFRIEESRELAGEPDGRADSDELSEPPALPSSPPPSIDPRPSFLHGLALGIKKPLGDKPKIPIKSSKVFQATRKAFQQLTPHSEKPSVKFDIPEVPQQQENLSDPLRTPQKRRAPKPPPTPVEDPSASVFARNPSASSKSYSPISREKEKRERASSCSPKSRSVGENVDKSEVVSTMPCPEPAPRRNISLSVESLPTGNLLSDNDKDSKKKPQSRSKFSIRKFLRIGSSKDLDDKIGSVVRPEEVVLLIPSPKPRPEIIHPLELDGQEVEVVRSDGSNARRSLEDTSSTSSFGSNEHRDNMTEASSDSFSSHSPNSSTGRPHKPPPPPRNQSLDAWGRCLEKPARPPPPKSAELLRKQLQPLGQSTPAVLPGHSVYANLDLVAGEVRSGMTPSKPQRSASIRDAALETPKRKFSAPIQGVDDGTYELVEIRHHDKKSTFLPNPSEGVYECVRNCSPESEVGVKVNHFGSAHRRSEGSVDSTPDYAKFRGQFQRTASLPYCGTETESDIYAPYSFYSNEEGLEDEGDYSSANGHTWKTNRLRLRKGRSIVHKNLEDNYGAVIIANHEALAQVLEQVNQIPVVPLPLRGLASMTNLRWADFAVLGDCPVIHAGRRVFHSAQWSGNNVTLCIAGDQSRLPNRSGSFTLAPLTEFTDLVPASYLHKESKTSTELIQASVAVLLHLQVDTIKSYGKSLLEKSEVNVDPQHKEASFVLLQFVNGLKNLQAQGIEESPLSLSSFVLCREEKDIHPRLYVLQSLGLGNGRSDDEEKGSLCQCAAEALKELIPTVTPFTRLVTETLSKERAISLTQVKSLLEFSLWGPGDVALGERAGRDREQALQRWLDLERATVLHGLVRTRVELTSFEECHLLFLVRTSAKMMCDASLLLESYRNQQ